MSLYGAGLIFVLLFMGFLYVAVAAKVWRGTSAINAAVAPEWWPFGLPVWRGVARSYVATGPFILVMFAGAAIAEFASAEDLGMGIAFLGLLGVPLVQLPIIFFNRPRGLVPPHQRDEPGALEERRRARRRPETR
jgi:hypothetical protein